MGWTYKRSGKDPGAVLDTRGKQWKQVSEGGEGIED